MLGIPNDDSVRLLGQIVEEMNLAGIYQSYSRLRNHQASPKQMLKILLYAYMNRSYSSRKIEIACKRDINFMYLLEGSHAPDHATIARFRNLHFAPKIVHSNRIKQYHLKKLRRQLKRLQNKEGILFVHGIGKRDRCCKRK